jgi:hypothetical protein
MRLIINNIQKSHAKLTNPSAIHQSKDHISLPKGVERTAFLAGLRVGS